jgi:hypothetical protein
VPRIGRGFPPSFCKLVSGIRSAGLLKAVEASAEEVEEVRHQVRPAAFKPKAAALGPGPYHLPGVPSPGGFYISVDSKDR